MSVLPETLFRSVSGENESGNGFTSNNLHGHRDGYCH
jgi:hypothetical protein